jgi:2'-5' RNA ligase
MDTTNSVVIVALPAVDDVVHKFSSEKKPHLTLLFLGDTLSNDQLIQATEFVQHAAQQMDPFGLTVDYRGTLGPDDADVLFFEKDHYSMPRVRQLRSNLLKNDVISEGYNSAEQFPEWTPHLTMGYPETPAKPDNRDYPGIHHVSFDRLAIWIGDSEGPEFRLKYEENMSDSSYFNDTVAHGALDDSTKTAVEEFFAHYGVPGMKWGVTTKDRAPQTTKDPSEVKLKSTTPGKFVKTEGGKKIPASDDAIKAAVGRQKAKASTTDALSNAELQAVVTRMNLEKQYNQLAFENDRRSRGQKFVAGLFGVKRPKKFIDPDEAAGERAREVAKLVKEELEKTAAARAEAANA